MTRKILTIAVFVLALTGAWAFKSNKMFAPPYGVDTTVSPNQCVTGVIQQQNCGINNPGSQCTVKLNSTGAIVPAFDVNTPSTTCATALKRLN